MYEKPSLVRFGSFRDVTRGGVGALSLDWAADSLKDFLLNKTPKPSAS